MLRKPFIYNTADKIAIFFISAYKILVFVELQFPAFVLLQSVISVQKKN